jgi:hypothetical protein
LGNVKKALTVALGNSNESSGSIKRGKFLDQLNYHQFFKDIATWTLDISLFTYDLSFIYLYDNNEYNSKILSSYFYSLIFIRKEKHFAHISSTYLKPKLVLIVTDLSSGYLTMLFQIQSLHSSNMIKGYSLQCLYNNLGGGGFGLFEGSLLVPPFACKMFGISKNLS